MDLNTYKMGKILEEYKITKGKEKWNKVVNNLSEEEILVFGNSGYKYDQVYNYVLEKERGAKDDLENTNTAGLK